MLLLKFICSRFARFAHSFALLISKLQDAAQPWRCGSDAGSPDVAKWTCARICAHRRILVQVVRLRVQWGGQLAPHPLLAGTPPAAHRAQPLSRPAQHLHQVRSVPSSSIHTAHHLCCGASDALYVRGIRGVWSLNRHSYEACSHSQTMYRDGAADLQAMLQHRLAEVA